MVKFPLLNRLLRRRVSNPIQTPAPRLRQGNPAMPPLNHVSPIEGRLPLAQRIVAAVQNSWMETPTVNRSFAGMPPGGEPPALTPPNRPTDREPQFAFPKRSRFFKAIPHLATAGLIGYVGIRVLTFFTIPWVSIPAAILLFGAELHCIINGLQYQMDIKNEKRYDKWKQDNWPTYNEINKSLSPEGPRSAMQIASAAEEPSTVWPTVYGTVEMEGNKQVIWNTQANVLWLSIGKVANQSVEGFRQFFSNIQNSPEAGIPSKLDLLETKYSIYPEVWENIRTKLATVETRDLEGLKELHREINTQVQDIAYMEKERLTESVNTEYGQVWGWIMQQVKGVTEGRTEVETANWIVPESVERADRVETVGSWQTLTPEQKKSALSNIYGMLGRRFVTRGGLWAWWGSERENVPEAAEMKRLLEMVFTGPLRTSGEAEETGLGREVDISNFGFADATGTFRPFSGNMEKLVEKIAEYMNKPGENASERLLYAFDYMRSLIEMDKREQAALGDLEYFPRNIRSAGEDITRGLEYETLAQECGHWTEADLDFQFHRVVNTYANHKVTRWDRDRFADLDHGGRKSNSINSLVHHLAGKWHKVIKREDNPTARATSGFTVAADTYSGLMRVFLEQLENGQYIWDTLRARIDRNHLNSLNPEQVANLISTEFAGIERDNGLKAKRWFFVNNFIEKLAAAENGPLTPDSFIAALNIEGIAPETISPAFKKDITRTIRWMNRETTVEKKRRILHFFFDQAEHHLDLTPRGSSLKTMVETAFRDQEVPEGYKIHETYNFDNIKYFTNLDAEVRPIPDFMARGTALLDRLIEKGEVPPEPTLMDRILFWRQRGGTIKAGFLQCPQFYTIDPVTGEPIHFTAHVDQRLFYQSIQPSKSLNDGSFSCGSNVIYNLAAKRETAERLFTEPGENNTQKLGQKPSQPGGWRYRSIASEIYIEDKTGIARPGIAYQTAESPTEDHASTVHFLDIEHGKKPERRKCVYLNDIVAKGEAPKDLQNLLGAQHPKWAGGTIGDFFYIIVPRYMRWMPGTSFIAKQALNVMNAMPRSVRGAASWTAKLLDKIFSRIPLVKHIWNFGKIMGKYSSFLTWETAMSNKPKMSPLSKVGTEFFRSGTWYFRGLRDLILIAAPVMLTTSVIGSALIGSIFTGLASPILFNPVVFGSFFLLYLTTTLTSYLYSTKRLGQKVSDVMLKKEAMLLGQGWPGYLHADIWGLQGPSGRLGATTTKGVGKRKLLAFTYAFPSYVAGVASLAGAGIGTWMLANTTYYLGAATAFSGPGIGIAICTFWALYHALMIFRGFQVSQGLWNTTKALGEEIRDKFNDMGIIRRLGSNKWVRRAVLAPAFLGAILGGGLLTKRFFDSKPPVKTFKCDNCFNRSLWRNKNLTEGQMVRIYELKRKIDRLQGAYSSPGKVPLEYLNTQRLFLADAFKELYFLTQHGRFLDLAIEALKDPVDNRISNVSFGSKDHPYIIKYFDLRLELAEMYRARNNREAIDESRRILSRLDSEDFISAQNVADSSVGGYRGRAQLILAQAYFGVGETAKSKPLLASVIRWSDNEAKRNGVSLWYEGKNRQDVSFLGGKARIVSARIAISERKFRTAMSHLRSVLLQPGSGAKDGYMDLGYEALTYSLWTCLETSKTVDQAKAKFRRALPWSRINRYADLKKSLGLSGYDLTGSRIDVFEAVLKGLQKVRLSPYSAEQLRQIQILYEVRISN